MLSCIDPTNYLKVQVFFKILIPHCLFRYIELESRSKQAIPYISHSIEEFINPRRTAHYSSYHYKESERFPTSPIFSKWQIKTLASVFKFNLTQLCKAHEHLYTEKLVIMPAIKPAMGEFDFRLEKRPQPIIYVKVALVDKEERRIHSMKDIRVTVE